MVDGWDEVHADLLVTDYSTVSLVACGLWGWISTRVGAMYGYPYSTYA